MTDAKARLLQMIADEPHMGGGGLLKAVTKAQKVAKTVERVAAPQDEALRLAQQRAALPIAQGGLGLPANNTPAQRATAMGFDADVYHGSKQDFNKFKGDQPIFAAEDPEIARLYGSFIYPLKLRGKVLEISDLGKDGAINRFPNNLAKELNIPRKELEDLRMPRQQFNDSSFLDKWEYLFNKRFGDPQFSDIGEREMVNKLPRYGIDRLKVTDMSDMGGTQTQHMIPAGSENIRSRFAAFDPFRRNAAIAAAMGVAAPDLLAKEKKAAGGAVHMAGGGRTPKYPWERYPQPKKVPEMRARQINPIAGAVKKGADYATQLIDKGPSFSSLVGNLVGAVPFVGPDLRKRMEASEISIPTDITMPSFMPEYMSEQGTPVYKQAGIEMGKIPTKDLMEVFNMSDFTPFAGLSNVAESIGYGQMPDALDLLDAAGVGVLGYGAVKAGAKGAKAAKQGALSAAKAAERFAEKKVPKVMESGGLGAQMLGAFGQNTQSNAVKPKGGNWVDTEVKRQLNNLKNDEDYSPLLVNSSKQDLAEIEKNPSAYLNSAQQIEILRRDIANMEQTNAFNKWVDTKAGGYLRNQMGTPDDPVVKSIDMRAMKAQADLEAGQQRLAALDGRIAEAEKTAVTPDELNQLAGMKRNRSQRAAELQSNYDLTLETMLPGGKSNQGYIYLGNHNYYLDAKRTEAGFPVEGYGQTRPGKAWEALTDANISTNPAKIFQNHEKKLAALKQAEDEYKNYRNVELKDKFRDFVNSQPNLADSTRRALIDGSSTAHMAGMVGDTERHEKLLDDVYEAQRKVNNSSMDAALDNPYLAKLPPEAPVYMLPGISELGIDHVIDVLKQDVAAGNIKLEDLNKITMEQALKRASEYDLDLAKKARDSVGASRAAMPVYKEYPEGYRWVQLTKPGEFRQESEEMGHSVKGYEPPKGHKDWSPASENSGDANYGHGGWEAIKSGQAKVYSLVDANHKPHVTIEVKQNPADKGFRGDEMPHGNDFYTQHNKYLDGQRSGELSPDIGFAEWWRSTQGIPEPEASPPIITQIKGKGNARPAAKYDQYTQDFVKSGNWGRVERDLKNTGLIESNGRYFTEPEFAEAAKKYGVMGVQDVPWEVARQRHADAGIPEDEAFLNWVEGLREGRGRLDIPDEPRMAGGGLLKALTKAQKTAKAVKAAESAMQNFTDIATPVIRSGTRKFDVPAAKTSVIKETGGNWLGGDVEQALKPLKRRTEPRLTNINEQGQAVGPQYGRPMTPEELQSLMADPFYVNNQALNKWIDSNLTNYVKKQMATPDDPIRKLAEEGVIHIPINDANRFHAVGIRKMHDGKQMGKSEAAQAWEDESDIAIYPGTVGEIKRVKEVGGPGADKYEPWMEKADPNTVVSRTTRNFSTQDLGFDHIVDVLKEDIATGRIRPEQLSKVSMEQAVRRTYEYDQEMAKKMRETQAKVTEGMPVHKDYSDKGYKWIELKAPDYNSLPLEERKQMIARLTEEAKQKGLTPEDYIERYPKSQLAEALKYEGNTMGHCVGGYCPDVLEGRSRIFSLRDAKGEPHVTVEVEPNQNPYPVSGEAFTRLSPQEKAQYREYVRQWRQRNPDVEELTDEHTAQALKEAGVAPQPDRIVQIKGKQNRAPKEDYLPFVQDFVKGGKFSDVGDLQNTGLRDLKNTPRLEEYLKSKNADVPRYLTEDEYKGYESDFLLDKKFTPRLGKAAENDPLTQRLLNEQPRMAEGGEVKSFFEEKSAKQRLLDMIAEEPHMGIGVRPSRLQLQGEIANDTYGGIGGGGRATYTHPVGSDAAIRAYMEGGGYKPKDMDYKGQVNNMGISYEKEFKDGGEVHMGKGGVLEKFKKLANAAKAAKVAEVAPYLPGVHYADPLLPPNMRLSEALGNAGAEGKTLNFTETDRSRVFGPNRGGAGFAGLQHYSLPHKEANTVWGFGSKGITEKKINQNDPENTIWTTYAGSPTQHKSNTVVVKDALGQLQAANKSGLVNPKQIEFINDRIRSALSKNGKPLFPKDFDITDPKAFDFATTFDRRAAISDALMGIGVKKPMISKEFKAANSGVQWQDAANIEAILRRETDPAMMGANTNDVGPNLFVMDNGIIHRPDLNEAFPYQVTGTDLGMRYDLTPFRDAAPDWIKARGIKPNEPINAWAMSRAAPSQFVSDKYLTGLQKKGRKEGGLAQIKKVKRHGNTVSN